MSEKEKTETPTESREQLTRETFTKIRDLLFSPGLDGNRLSITHRLIKEWSQVKPEEIEPAGSWEINRALRNTSGWLKEIVQREIED